MHLTTGWLHRAWVVVHGSVHGAVWVGGGVVYLCESVTSLLVGCTLKWILFCVLGYLIHFTSPNLYKTELHDTAAKYQHFFRCNGKLGVLFNPNKELMKSYHAENRYFYFIICSREIRVLHFFNTLKWYFHFQIKSNETVNLR